MIEVNRAAVPLTQDCQPGTTDKKYEGHYDAHPPIWLSRFQRLGRPRAGSHEAPSAPQPYP